MTTAKKTLPRAYITDHGLLRYLERVQGVDVQMFRGRLEQLLDPYVAVGAKRVVIDGFAYEFDDNRLTTCQPAKHGKSRRRVA